MQPWSSFQFSFFSGINSVLLVLLLVHAHDPPYLPLLLVLEQVTRCPCFSILAKEAETKKLHELREAVAKFSFEGRRSLKYRSTLSIDMDSGTSSGG